MAVFIVFVAYLLISSFFARRYYLRRHGVMPERGGAGAATAGFIGLIWPASLWMPTVQSPQYCNHPRHLAERARIRDEIDYLETIRQQERR